MNFITINIRPGKLDSQFIVTARIDFQIFSYFRLYTETLAPPPRSLQSKGVASAIASSNLALFALFY